MENLFKFLDYVEDLVIAAAWRLRRALSRRPRERRRAPRIRLATRQS